MNPGQDINIDIDLSGSGLDSDLSSLDERALWLGSETEIQSANEGPVGRDDSVLEEQKYNSTTLCHFYANGHCRNGNVCNFRHEADCGQSEVRDEPDVRHLLGCMVRFGDGATVEDIKLPSDRYTVVVYGPTELGGTLLSIQNKLNDAGIDVPVRNIQIRQSNGNADVQQQIFITSNDPKLKEYVVSAVKKSKVREIRASRSAQSVQATLKDDIDIYAVTNNAHAVVCSFHKPSKRATIYYASSKRADAKWAERRLRGEVIGQRKIKVRYIDSAIRPVEGPRSVNRKNCKNSRRTERAVEISGLDPETSIGEIREILGPNHRYAALDMPDSSRNQLPTANLPMLLARILETRGFRTKSVLPIAADVDPVQFKAVVEFDDQYVCERVFRSGGFKIDQRGRKDEVPKGGVSIHPRSSKNLKVLAQVLQAVRADVEDLMIRSWHEDFVHIRIYPPTSPTDRFSRVRIYGMDSQAVTKTATVFQSLIEGTRTMDGEIAVWDDFFSTFEGLNYLKSLYAGQNDIFIYRDNRRRTLWLHGRPEGVLNLKETLIRKVKDLNEFLHVIKLEAGEFKAAVGGGFQEISSLFDKNAVSLNVREPKTLSIYGTDQDLKTARSILRSHLEVLADEDADIETACPICFESPTDPYYTPCGHAYCNECFVDQCRAVTIESIPVTCYGGMGACGRVFTLAELRAILPSTALEALLKGAFQTHVRSHPDVFLHCATPDCPTIYRKTSGASTLICHSCPRRSCTACGMAEHLDTSCEDARDLASQGQRAFERYKLENGLKDCPKCKTTIQRAFGSCNNMTCSQCRNSFCWYCLGIYGTHGLVCEHMIKDHGGSYFAGIDPQGFQWA